MPDERFHCYGENSFTFLLFQALTVDGRFPNLLLRNLKRFGDGRRFFDGKQFFDDTNFLEEQAPDIWLFPNFGKMYGFSEPDALVLYGKYSFWFEVETVVNLRTRLPALRGSLLQLARFHFFHQALKHGAKTRKNVGVPHEVFIGPTISNSGRPKFGILRRKGHPVLQKIGKKLADSRPHYVLLSEAQSKGISNGELLGVLEESSANLRRILEQWAEEVGYQGKNLPSLPETSKHWYAYWKGDLEPKFIEKGLDPIGEGRYVRIASA